MYHVTPPQYCYIHATVSGSFIILTELKMRTKYTFIITIQEI